VTKHFDSFVNNDTRTFHSDGTDMFIDMNTLRDELKILSKWPFACNPVCGAVCTHGLFWECTKATEKNCKVYFICVTSIQIHYEWLWNTSITSVFA